MSIGWAQGEGSDKIRVVTQWEDTQWASMERAFVGCKNLKITATVAPDLSQVVFVTGMFDDVYFVQR